MKSFDIETIPNPAMIERLPAVKPAYGNTKDPDKRAVIDAEAKQKQIDNMALSPFYGRICAASFCEGEGKTSGAVITDISDKAEINLITFILDGLVIAQTETNAICSFNGIGFDFPFAYKRAMILRIPLPAGCPPLRYWTKRYSSTPHCDLMQELSGWNNKEFVSLDEAASVILGKKKTERDYKTFTDLIKNGKQGEISDACAADALLTYELWEVVSKYL
jgi:predicted PolB exonuclease-like 3'-5' exonuclease